MILISGLFLVCAFSAPIDLAPSCDDPVQPMQPSVGAGVKALAGPIVFEFPFRVNGAWYRLRVDNQGVEGKYFAEHRGDGRLLALNDPLWTEIQISDRMGNLLESISVPDRLYGGPGQINALFTTSTGALICKQADTSRIWRYDSVVRTWANTGTVCPWLGTKSIAESNGVIMIAEYCSDTSPKARVFRSRNDGRTWEVVFEKRAGVSLDSGNPEVRHLHTAVADPWTGVWYVSSGDIRPHCRVWMSEDKGDSWTEITDPDPESENPAFRNQALHRVTTWLFDERPASRHILPSDDRHAGAGAALAVSPSGNPLQLRVLGRLTNDQIRAAILYPGLGWLMMTEDTTEYPGVELVFVSREFEIVPVGILTGITGYFTSSEASTQAEGDLEAGGMAGFTLARGVAIPNRTLRYTITREYAVEVEIGRPDCGSVEILPAGHQGGWKKGDQISLRAIPAPASHFCNYRGDLRSRRPEIVFTVQGDTRIRANFALDGQAPPEPLPVLGAPAVMLALALCLAVSGLRRLR